MWWISGWTKALLRILYMRIVVPVGVTVTQQYQSRQYTPRTFFGTLDIKKPFNFNTFLSLLFKMEILMEMTVETAFISLDDTIYGITEGNKKVVSMQTTDI